jgi:hypothetical protein
MMAQKFHNFKETLIGPAQLLTLEQIRKLKTKPNLDYYVSLFAYNKEHKERLEKTGSLAGIKDVVSDSLLWDFDSTDVEKARLDTVALANRLVDDLNVDPDSIVCYYSGQKGFHVVLPLDREITPEQFKHATGTLAKGLETYDTVVNDPQRLIRLEYTKHPKSGLFKVPLHITEVDELTVDQIKALAKTSREDYTQNSKPVTLPASLFTVKPKKETMKNEITLTDKFDKKSIPIGWKDYKWSLAQGFFDSGGRHQALMIIAATCRGLGYPKEQAYYLCKAALKKQSERTGSPEFDKEELWNNIIQKSIYSDNWEGGQYSPATNEWLKKYCERMGFDTTHDPETPKVIQMQDIENGFEHYVRHIEQNTILTGIKCLDVSMPLTTGMNLGVIGAASSGKTALALSILKNTSKAGVISVFASLDMHRNRLFEKLLYKVSGLGRDDLYAKIKNGQAKAIFDQVREEYKNVFFYDRSRPTVGDIRKYILQVEEQTGKKVKLVMLDYFERVNSEKSEDTAASKDISGQLQDLVNDLDICMVTLVQPNKFSLSGGPDSPILNYTAIKGSSFLYQSFRSILSIWRPFFNPEWSQYDKFMKMAILKNDLGELNLFNFGWSGKKGEIWELAEEGEEELEKLMKQKDQAKANAAAGSDGWV